MHSDFKLSRLIYYFSPKVWLVIAVASMLLASGSGMVLVSHLSEGQKDKLFWVYDSVGRFMRDTVRLTFKTDKNKDAVFVAPRGILKPATVFHWVENYQDFVPRSEDTPPEPKAPVRLLDPDWKPVFSGI